MSQPVYFDTSVFLEVLAKKSKHASQIRELLEELRHDKVRIYTSILTVQESSVLTYRRGAVAYDNYAAISEMARIYTVDKLIALTAAKREAEIRDMSNENPAESEAKQRRRWDCIHIATAQVLECDRLFTTDPGMIKRKRQLALNDIEILNPIPSNPKLNFDSQPRLTMVQPPKERLLGKPAAGEVQVKEKGPVEVKSSGPSHAVVADVEQPISSETE